MPKTICKANRKILIIYTVFAVSVFCISVFYYVIGIDGGSPLQSVGKDSDVAIKTRAHAQMMRLPLSFEVNNGQTDAQVKFLSRGGAHSVFFTPDKIVMGFSARKADKGNEDSPSSRPSRLGGEKILTAYEPQSRKEISAPAEIQRNVIPAHAGIQGLGSRFRGNDEGKNIAPLAASERGNDAEANRLTPRREGANRPEAGSKGRDSAQVRDLTPVAGAKKAVFARSDSDEAIQKNASWIAAPPTRRGGQNAPDTIRHSMPSPQNANSASSPRLAAARDDEKEITRKTEFIELHPVGANSNPQIVGESELQHKSNYFKGNDPAKWHSNVANYAKVRYKEVYPGIDLVFYGNQGRMEFDFVVSPGADPNVIRMAVAGEAELNLVPASGDLRVTLGESEIVFHAPIVYQERAASGKKLIDGAFALLRDGKGFAFRVGDYDKSQPLIIDPSLSFSTFLGGTTSTDFGTGIAVDSSGNIYVSGYTSSSDFPTSSTTYKTSYGGSQDVFVAKINPTASTLVYATYLGGSSGDTANGIAVDSSGNVFVTGTTSSSNFPFVSSINDSQLKGASDAFVTKINSSGASLGYSLFLGGSGSETAAGIAVDSSGNAYVAGQTTSSNFPTTSAAFDKTLGGSQDAFVTKINSAGSSAPFSTYLGGSMNDSAAAIAIDSAGNVYVTGNTQSSDFPTANAYSSTLRANYDVFITKLAATGSALVFSTFFGGSGDDFGQGIAVDSSGNVLIAGYSNSTDSFPLANAYQTTCGGCSTTINNDAFIAKLGAAGSTLAYSTFLGGASDDKAYGIAADSAGNAYVVGSTLSSDFPAINAVDSSISGQDAFVAKFFHYGLTPAFSTFLGGSSTESGAAIAVDGNSIPNIYVTGNTTSTDFPVTTRTYDSVLGGSSDAFVSKYEMSFAVPAPAFSASASSRVVSPYWQADSGVYSLVAVSHPSLSGMASQIGVRVVAVNGDGNTAFSPAVEFTVTSNTTKRLLIVSEKNTALSPVTTPSATFITGNGSNGVLAISPVATQVNRQVGGGFQDITMLSYWGAVVVQGTATGFAMEFVGDLHDSIDTGSNIIQGSGLGGFVQGGVGLN